MNEENYPECVLNYVATEELVSEKELELKNLDAERIESEERLEYLLDMVKKASEVGKEIKYLDRQIDEIDNHLLDLSIKLEEGSEELSKLQNDLDKYQQETENAGWEYKIIGVGLRTSVKWVKKNK
jgi:ribosome assembly protein YihI (activator of Der GTPase)